MGRPLKRRPLGHATYQPSSAERAFMRRRTAPFLDNVADYPLIHILMEVYLQGIRDAVQVMTEKNPLA